MKPAAIPAGFAWLEGRSPTIDLVGPVYARGKGLELVLGLRCERKHCNTRGTVHGGILATLADIALGYSLSSSTEPPTAAVTASLSLDFIGAANEGDWLETRVDFHKLGKRLAFANCFIERNTETIARASAVFVVTGTLEKK
jgi:acyl-coenzyme A thioesterase 13